MKKLLVAGIVALSTIFCFGSTTLASSDNQPKENHSNYWNGVWQDFKGDWQAIGNGIKNTGANIGHSLKNEFQGMPENFRQGCKEAKSDFKTFTGSNGENPTPQK